MKSTSVSSKKSSVLTSCRSSTLDILRGLSFDTVVEKQREIMCRIRWWYDWLNTGSRCFTEKVNWADSVHYESSSIAVELCFGRKFGLRYRTISDRRKRETQRSLENTQMAWCNTGSKSNAVKQTVGQIKSQIRHKLVNEILSNFEGISHSPQKRNSSKFVNVGLDGCFPAEGVVCLHTSSYCRLAQFWTVSFSQKSREQKRKKSFCGFKMWSNY